jgi:hypothetical protein
MSKPIVSGAQNWLALCSRFTCDEAEKLLAIGTMFLGEVFVAERLEVFDDKSRLLNCPAEDVGIEEIDERRQSVPPLRCSDPAWGQRCQATDLLLPSGAETLGET